MYGNTFGFIALLCALFLLLNFAYFVPLISRRPVVLYKNFIQGTWLKKGVNQAGQNWTFSYVFEDGLFEMKGDPQFEVSGKYRIVKEVEKLVVLELSHITGESAHTIAPIMKVSIAIDNKNDRIQIDNRSYERTKMPQKKANHLL